MNFLTTNEIDKAYDRIKHIILKTPLVSSESINKITKANIYFKLENLQLTGSFKIRGALNKIEYVNALYDVWIKERKSNKTHRIL